MHFDWTITLGNILSTFTVILMFMGGAWKLISNHLRHVEDHLTSMLLESRNEISTQITLVRTFVSQRLDRVDDDIRELRSYYIPYKDNKSYKPNE